MKHAASTELDSPNTPIIEFSTLRLDATAPIKRHRGTWDDIITRLSDPKVYPTKPACPLIKLATFGDKTNARGALRHDGNVQGIYGIEGDYDGEQVMVAEAAARLRAAGVEAVIYTSASHTPEKPRWRVLAPLSCVHLPSQRRDLVSLLNGALGGILNGESWTLSQVYYFGHVAGAPYEFEHVTGEYLDTIELAGGIDPIGKGGTQNTPPPRQDAADFDEILTEDQFADLRSALTCVDADSRETWVRMGHALKRYGEDGRELWLEYSQRSAKYDEEDAADKWESFSGDRTSYAAVFAEAQRNGWANPQKKQQASAAEQVRESNVVPFGAFCADLAPPRYVWHRVLQYGCLYGLTAKWGHGKTAVMLTVAQHAATGKTLGGHPMERCRVLYLCGENPADVKLRAVAIAQRFGFTPEELSAQIYFTTRPFSIDVDEEREGFVADAREHGPYGLVVIDTGPAHSAAEEENDNREMHALAMAMRDLMEPLGMPATVALMHPTKDAARDNLQPRGGGAFSGSIDGELCAWQVGGLVEFFHRTKFRGPGFEPMLFKLEAHELPDVRDNFGSAVSTVVAVEATAEDRPARQPTGKWRLAAWRAVHDLIEIGEEWASVEAVVAKVLECVAFDSTTGKRDTRKQRVIEALNELKDGFVEIDGATNRVRVLG